MRYPFHLILICLLSCSKESFAPDLRECIRGAVPMYIYSAPQSIARTDTAFYFGDDVYLSVTAPHGVIDLYYGQYAAGAGILAISWKSGPLQGMREIFRPVVVYGAFVQLRSVYRSIWIRT